MTQDRRERKDVYYLYRAMWNKRDTTLHLADKRHRLRDTERQAFKVYSSAAGRSCASTATRWRCAAMPTVSTSPTR